jgi:ankyrin repeat protein
MNKWTMVLAGLLSSSILAGAALAADTTTINKSSVPLVTAAKAGDRAAVRSLLNGIPEKVIAGPEGTAALVWAASRNDAEMADMLLRAGADVKGANEFGATPLYAAAADAELPMAQKLLAAGADPNAALLSGETPLMQAARRGNVDIVRALLAAKADPNAKEKNGGQNALMWALAQRQSATVDELVRGGADVNAGSKSDFTPMMFAAQQGDVDSIRILLRAGAKLNGYEPGTVTPLIIASAMNHVQAVDLMLDNGADPNAVDWRSYSALLLVVRDSHYGIDLASKDKVLAIVKSLLAHGANPNIRLKQPKALTANDVSLDGATPILLAAEVNNTEVVKALLDAGADPRITTEQGMTPLIMAAGGGTDIQRARAPEERAMAIETVKLLVERSGVDITAAGQYGWTALHAASYQGLTDVIEYLVSKGADVNEMDSFGQTPLSIALAVLVQDIGARRLQIPRRYRRDVAEQLLRLGATPLDKSGVVVVLQRTGDLELGRDGTQE